MFDRTMAPEIWTETVRASDTVHVFDVMSFSCRVAKRVRLVQRVAESMDPNLSNADAVRGPPNRRPARQRHPRNGNGGVEDRARGNADRQDPGVKRSRRDCGAEALALHPDVRGAVPLPRSVVDTRTLHARFDADLATRSPSNVAANDAKGEMPDGRAEGWRVWRRSSSVPCGYPYIQ